MAFPNPVHNALCSAVRAGLRFRLRRALASGVLAIGLVGCGDATPSQQVAETIDVEPSLRLAMAAIEQHFPEDHELLIHAFEQEYQQNGAAGFNELQSTVLVDFLDAIFPAIAAAPAADVAALVDDTLAFFHVLEVREPAICARFVVEGSQSAFIEDPDVSEALGRLNATMIRTARAGMDSNDAPRAPPNEADMVAMMAGISGVDPRAASILANRPAATSDADNCAIGIAMYQTLAAMPDEQAARLYMEMNR